MTNAEMIAYFQAQIEILRNWLDSHDRLAVYFEVRQAVRDRIEKNEALIRGLGEDADD